MSSTGTLARQVINIGVQSNDGTGDSIREAFRKTNENFIQLYNRLGATEAGFSFFGTLADTPSVGIGNSLLVTSNTTTAVDVTITQVELIGGTGIEINKTESSWTIINTASSLITDNTPTLAADLNGNNFRATVFASPIDDTDLVTRKFLYDNFLNRDGTYSTGTSVSTSSIAGGSTLRENIKLTPSATTSSVSFGKTISIYSSTGSLTTVDLGVQASDPAHIVRKDYADTKISLQGVDTIDPATGNTNTSFGKMTGPLILSRTPQTSDDRNYNGLIAATKGYVDSNSFYSDNNIFVTQKGRDYQPEIPPIRRGRSQAYAFATINKAAQYAEKLIETSKIEVGDYARLITYNNGTAAKVFDTTDNYYGNNLARLRLSVGNLGSDQFGVAGVGEFTIFPGQYIEGVDSKAIALIENIQKGENSGDPEIYSILYVDYGDDFATTITTDIPDLSNGNRVRFTFDDETMVPIPDFWMGYQFYTDNGSQGTIVEIGDTFVSDDVTYKRGVYHNYFIVEFSAGAPDAGITFPENEWHVYSGDFIEGENVVYNTNVSALQITLVVESGEYYEQYPIKLAANVSIRGDEFRRCIIRPADGPSASIWANTYFRRDAQTDGLQTSDIDYTTDYAGNGTLASANAIPSGSGGVITVALSTGSMPALYKGYMFVANGGQGIITETSDGGFTVNLGTAMLNAAEIPSGDWHIYKPILFGYHYLRDPLRPMNLLTTLNNPGGMENAAQLLTLNRNLFQEEVIAYIDATYGGGGTFTYDQAKCYRDTGLIVDAIAQDLLFSTSSQSTFAGIQYWAQTSTESTIPNELTTTTNAINHIKAVAQQIIVNSTGTVVRYTTATQVISTSTATSAEVSILGSKFDVITNILTSGISGITDQIVPNNLSASTTASVLTAYNLLQTNKAYLQAEAVAFVEATKPAFYSYNTATCYRDVGYIIDSVAFDLLYSGNKQSIQSGAYYYGFSATTSTIEGQSVQARAAYNYIRTLIPSIVKGQAISTSTLYQTTQTQVISASVGTGVEGLTAQKKIDVITHIINLGPSAIDGKNPIPLTRSTSTDVINAANLLHANRTFIQAETIAYINDQLTGFIYDKATCKRDVGLIVDSLAHDLIYGGSERTVYAGESYRDVAVVQATETVQTADAVVYLNSIAQQVLTNTTITQLTTATQVINTSIVKESNAPDILSDLSQALSRIILGDAEYNPPKTNDQLDVFLMNDANVIRYVSCQNHGGFMQVLDPAGQIKNKSPYTQTASSFSQSIAKHRFAGGMLVDGFSGNVMCTPVDWDPVNSPLDLQVTGLIRRPQVPTFFMNQGVRYEVDFFANFQPAYLDDNGVQRYSATLKLNPLIPGGIGDTVAVLDTVGGFLPNKTDIPIIVEQPTGIGGLGARGYATSDAGGAITSVNISFPGTGYESTPYISIGGAILNNLTIVSGQVTNASIVSGGYGYAPGCRIEIIPVGIVGGVKAVGQVTQVDNGTGSGNGTITQITITTGGANWTSSVNYRVAFGNMDITVPAPNAGFLDTAPTEVELVTAGNRSMLANDFTQVNDLGYGIFVTNGGFMENVSMFTYYCYRSYYSLNGSQVRTLTGSSCYGSWGLVADGSDPMEVPLSLTNVYPMVQQATAYVAIPSFPAQTDQTYIYVEVDSTAGGYPPMNGSIIEINHGGIRKQYSIGSASPALNSSNELIPNVYQLFFNTGNVSVGTEGTGLLTSVSHGDPVIIRASSLVKVTGFNPVSIARPSTSLTWDDDSTYIYHITSFSNVQPDGSVFAYTQEDYNYIVFQAVDQGVVHPTLVSGGSGYTSSATTATITSAAIVSGATHNVFGTQGLGTIGIQTIKLDSVANVKIGHRVSTGTYILTDTFVTWVDSASNQICISNPTAGAIPDATSLTFTATYPAAHVQISSGTITSIVVDEGGAGWNATTTAITLTGDGIGAAVISPVKIAGVAGSNVVKITSLELTSQNRILSGLAQSPKRYYQFGFGDEIYNITGYTTPSSRGVVFEVGVTAAGTGTTYSSIAVSSPGTGYSQYQELTILGSQLGGTSPENDLTVIVTTVNSSGGVIAVNFTGTSYQSVYAIGNYTDVSPPDDGQVSAEITLDKPLAESISKGTILRAGISINSPGSLTTKISILRATGHDFVDIGTGGYATTRIPNDLYGPPILQRAPTQEVLEINRGRVYYVTTDQDGNFRVGDALTVNQAQGSVTISVPLDLSNLSAISLRRDLGPPINEFSIDSTLISEADYKVPTEQAVANYINRRLGLDRNGNIYAGSPLGPQFLSLDGQLAMKADLNMANHRIVNLQNVQDPTDGANKGYVDTKISNAGQAAINVDGVSKIPDWGVMTGSLRLFNDPDVKTATVATTASINDTSITFDLLTTTEYQPGDFYGARINVAGVPVGTIIGSIYPDSVTLGLQNPDTGNNAVVTQVIPAGTVVYFDPVKQASTKRYVDKRSQLINLADVSVSSATDVDLLMFGPPAPVNTTSNINPSIYTSSTWLMNVRNNSAVIANTPSSIGGGSDISIARSGNTVTFKLRGGTVASATNPITDYHINSWAQIQQSKLLMNTATTTATAWIGTQSQIQARLGLSSFDSRMFTATSGWVTLVDSTGTSSGVQTNKQAWVPTGGGLLGATNTAADTSATYVTSASIKTWLGNEATNWKFASDLNPITDLARDIGAPTTRWSNIYANTGTFSQGIAATGTWQGVFIDGVVMDYVTGMARITTGANDGITFYNGNTATRTALVSVSTSGDILQLGGTLGTQATTQNVFNTTATTVNAFGAATSMTLGAITGYAIVRNPNLIMSGGLTFAMNGSNPSITTVDTGAASVFNTNALTGNLFGSATNITIGGTSGTLSIRNGTVTLSNATVLNMNGASPSIVTNSAGTASVFNTNATTGNLFGAATTINIGAAASTANFAGDISAVNIYDTGYRVVTTLDASVTGNGLTVDSEVQTGPAVSFNIKSNATATNTANTIVWRDPSGNFSAGTVTANLQGTVTPAAIIGAGGTNIALGTIGTNDYARIRFGADAADAGWIEIATADNGTEPIYVRQYNNAFSGSPLRTATLLDGSGNTVFPNDVYMSNLRSNGGTSYVYGTWQLGSGATWQATFADLAEYYTADVVYEPGTVLIFGGEKELTTTNIYADSRVAGVVSTNAAYIMNADCVGTRACIALQGRVPVKVMGTVKKGDLLTTADHPGYATKAIDPKVGTIIGKALENKDTTEPGIIEVAIGRN